MLEKGSGRVFGTSGAECQFLLSGLWIQKYQKSAEVSGSELSVVCFGTLRSLTALLPW